MESIFVWLALSPPQVQELRDRRRISPDVNTARFDLSVNTSPARSPEENLQSTEFSLWEYTVLRMEITSLGYFRKMEGNVLEKISPGEFRWHGMMELEEIDGQGRLLYRVIEKPEASSTMSSHEPQGYRNLRN